MRHFFWGEIWPNFLTNQTLNDSVIASLCTYRDCKLLTNAIDDSIIDVATFESKMPRPVGNKQVFAGRKVFN